MATCKDCLHVDCYDQSLEDAETCNFFLDKQDYQLVVRCKDCKHSHNYPSGSYSCSFHEYEGEPHVEPNDFCSYGERRDNNE